MRLKIEAPKGAGKKIKESLSSIINVAENESYEDCFSYTFTVDPGKYREFDEIVRKATRNKGSLEVIDVCVTDTDSPNDS